mgnify:FL=1
MRRKLCLILALIMLFTAIPHTTFALQDYDKQLEQAIIKCKKLFNIGDEYDKFNSSVSNYDGTTVFYLVWTDSKGQLGSIDVSITADGDVLSYSKWDISYKQDRPKLPKISKEEGLKIAKQFIQKVSPKFANNIKYIDNQEPLDVNSDRYTYRFIRTEKGIPYYNNSIDIHVSNSTGQVLKYYVNWDMNIVFADNKGIITVDEAQKLYREKIGLNLLYKLKYVGDSSETYLAYGPLNTNLAIEAKKGEVVSYYEYIGIYDRGAMGGIEKSIQEELSPDEKKAIESLSGIIPKKEAEQIGREILGLDSKYKLEYINLYKYYIDDSIYLWEIGFTKENNNDSYYARISIDAKTGNLISFYKYIPTDPSKKPKFNREESIKIAEEFIDKMNPDKKDLIEFNQYSNGVVPLDDQQNYYFEFNRKLGNAYVENEGIYVSVDAVNGVVNNYSINWSNRDFPSQDNVIPLDEAYEILYSEIGLELKYIVAENNGKNPSDKREAILVYGLSNNKPANIDANTGIILDYNGKPFKESIKSSYKDIEDSYAKDKINVLVQYGIALPGEEFKPKDKIIQRDFLYMLAKANSPYVEIDDSEDKLYSYLMNVGVVKEGERFPERVVTKEEAIKFIIRALNYDEIADISEIYKDLFKDTKDISPGLKGYVAIAYGLKIVEGYNGFLNPKAELKREDAASIIYNYLFNGK